MALSSTFVPRVPQPAQPLHPVPPPFPIKKRPARVKARPKTSLSASPPAQKVTAPTAPAKPETLLSWAAASLRAGIKSLPKTGSQLLIQIGIVVAINLLLWPLKTYTLPGPIAKVVAIMIFLTATYNDVVPKTIYWVIVFTFGKKLVGKIRAEGLAAAIAPMKGIAPELKRAQAAIGEQARSMLLAGAGLGLMIANNFASYSRFSGARNKSDKYFVALVISFTVSYLLGEKRDGGLFKFVRLANSDLCRLLGRPNTFTDSHAFVLLSGFVLGLLLDAPLIMMKLMYGGYILGGVVLVAGIVTASSKAKQA